ncbi:MAG: hypothetical protein CMJ19_16935 [Phycisphaeraceae bacterium]|nr:hypothetical protein [Phycisphaeraceae bacterium]
MNTSKLQSDEKSAETGADSPRQPTRDPMQRPLLVDLIGVITGILMFLAVGLWFTRLYAPNSQMLELSNLVHRSFGLFAGLWLILYVTWFVTSSKQRKKNLQSHRQQANDNYQLGQVRKEIDSRR